MVHLQGLEPWTHWLRVSCSTSWAKGASNKKSCMSHDPIRNLRSSLRIIDRQPSSENGHWKPNKICKSSSILDSLLTVQALGLLVSVNWTHYCAYISDLSTRSLRVTLPAFSCGISYLEVCFTRRCLQRLSHPHVATQLCSWRNNWCTRGASNPVLSY